jgi:SNF2 family DNA or RNA helicase
MLNRKDLHAYQYEKMVPHIINNNKCALYVDMGLGKTASTLTAISDLFDDFDIARVLIVAPLRVALNTWPDEIENWSHTKHLTYTQLAGLPARERKALCLQDRAQIHIINVDLVAWLVEFVNKKWPYDMVVIDESSLFKSSNSKRFKYLVMVLHAVGIRRIVQLTGTPTSNGLLDLWSQVYLLDTGKRLGYSVTTYRDRYFDHNVYEKKWEVRKEAEEVIHNRLKDICLRLDANDYLKMPKRIINDMFVVMPPEHRELYDELKREFLIKIEDETIVAAFAASLTNKLLQFCNGAVYLDDTGRYKKIHDKKLEALDEILEEAAGEPVLIAYQFKSDKERILNRYKNAVALDKDPETIQRWNEGKIEALVAHPASAGHGLNLQKGGHIMVWFGLTWSLELYQQFNARLYRQGQTKPVIIHRIMMENTIEAIVESALNSKFKTQYELLNALRETARGFE